jgi:hypothetical protein
MGNSPLGRVAGIRILIAGAARGMRRSHALRLADEGADGRTPRTGRRFAKVVSSVGGVAA